MAALNLLRKDIRNCRLCSDDFERTETHHRPRPVVWLGQHARILVAGQAPGLRVHESGKPFTDPSGDRLRNWMGVDSDIFYDTKRVAILPMAFCFPGYDAKGSDLPPPKRCAETWRANVLSHLPNIRLTLLIGGYAHRWHLQERQKSVTDTVANWQTHLPHTIPLPHPSWRNTGWIKKNPWFETELLPVLKSRVAEALT